MPDGSNALAGPARLALMRGWAHWQALNAEIAWLERQIAEHAKTRKRSVACRQFKNGRRMAAWLGIVPMQKSSGRRQRLGRTTKQGDAYLRTLLFQGARSVVLTAH
jgi:transposase